MHDDDNLTSLTEVWITANFGEGLDEQYFFEESDEVQFRSGGKYISMYDDR